MRTSKRTLDRIAHPRLCSEMGDRMGLGSRQSGAESPYIGTIRLVVHKAPAIIVTHFGLRELRALENKGVIAVAIVGPHDLLAVFHRPLGGRAAPVAGVARSRRFNRGFLVNAGLTHGSCVKGG